jgi:hypothetical protein
MDRVSKRGQNHVDAIATIADKAEAFYTKSGKSLSNYNALVADVNAKKSAAQAAVNVVKSDQASFKCDGADPKGTANTFKDDVKKMESAIKDYKTSVKSLIAGIKTVTKSSEGGQQ